MKINKSKEKIFCIFTTAYAFTIVLLTYYVSMIFILGLPLLLIFSIVLTIKEKLSKKKEIVLK